MPKSPRSQPGAASRGKALGELFDETVMLYNRLTAAAAAVHGAGETSGPRRSVLAMLARSGPMTVAHMARARAQARQRIQPLVNGLIAEGLVETRPNPAHRQSPLVALTKDGERMVGRILDREQSLRAQLVTASSAASLTRASAVLRDVRQTVEAQLPGLLKRSRVRSRRPRSRSAS